MICLVIKTFQDQSQEVEVATLELAMMERKGVAEGASECVKIEIYLKVSEADNSHMPWKSKGPYPTAKSRTLEEIAAKLGITTVTLERCLALGGTHDLTKKA